MEKFTSCLEGSPGARRAEQLLDDFERFRQGGTYVVQSSEFLSADLVGKVVAEGGVAVEPAQQAACGHV